MSLTTRKMSRAHEEHVAEVLGARLTRNSGAVWSDQSDFHQIDRDARFRVAGDGKATLSKSISITREMWKKTKEQARGLEPIMPLRFYVDDRLTKVEADLVVVDLDFFAEILQAANDHWENQ